MYLEVYTLGKDDLGNEFIIIQDDDGKDVWFENHIEFDRMLREEVNVRRNGDKRQGLIGG